MKSQWQFFKHTDTFWYLLELDINVKPESFENDRSQYIEFETQVAELQSIYSFQVEVSEQ